MPTPATILLSAPAGRADAELRALVAAAGFAVADHALGSAPAVDFDAVVIAVVDAGERIEAAAAQTRRWRAELGDRVVPVLWVAPTSAVAVGLDAGADVVLPRPLEAGAFAAQLRALARAHATAARVAARAAEARLLGDQLKKTLAHLDREHDLARRVHAGFRPRALPQVGRARFTAFHRSRGRTPCDFYTVQRLDEHHAGFVVGDAVGAGGSAGGLLGAFVQQCVTMKEITDDTYRIVPPDEVLSSVNRRLLELGADDPPLVALLAGVLNADTGRVVLARAGLPAPVYVPAHGAPVVWAVPGPFLGAADSSYQLLTGVLEPGDRLLIGTDGTRPDGPGGTDRLLEAAAAHRALAGEAFVGAVARELLQHVRHGDDFTLLGVEV